LAEKMTRKFLFLKRLAIGENYINKMLKEKKHFIYVVFTYRKEKRRRGERKIKVTI